MSGKDGLAATRIAADGMLQVYLQLAPGEACIVRTYNAPAQGSAYAYWKPAAMRSPLPAHGRCVS